MLYDGRKYNYMQHQKMFHQGRLTHGQGRKCHQGRSDMFA